MGQRSQDRDGRRYLPGVPAEADVAAEAELASAVPKWASRPSASTSPSSPTSSFPLTREKDDPTRRGGASPKNWFPGAVLFDSDSILDLLRQLGRLRRRRGA